MIPAEERQIPALAGINLLGLANDIVDYLAAAASKQPQLSQSERRAFIAGAVWAAQEFSNVIAANMPPDGPQPDGMTLFTNRE